MERVEWGVGRGRVEVGKSQSSVLMISVRFKGRRRVYSTGKTIL